MKKTIVRVLAFALVLLLALGILPLGALAATVDVWKEIHTSANPKWDDPCAYAEQIDSKNGTSVTIKTSDYDKYIVHADGKLYDLKGIFDWDDYAADKTIKMSSSLTYTDNEHHYVSLGYVPHSHGLSRWYSDDTTHWRECMTCKEALKQYDQFLNRNWHSDGDEDRICDVCGADIPYHDITVIDSKGGKITVNLEEAPHRQKITASVELEEGYKLKKLHFTKVRTDGSKQEIRRRKTDKTTWWTYMPTYDLEVTAEYVKK